MQSIETDPSIREDAAKACRGDLNEEESRTVAATAHPRRGGGGANLKAMPGGPNYSCYTLPSASPVVNNKKEENELPSEDGVDPLSSATPLPDSSISKDKVRHKVFDPSQIQTLDDLLAWYYGVGEQEREANLARLAMDESLFARLASSYTSTTVSTATRSTSLNKNAQDDEWFLALVLRFGTMSPAEREAVPQTELRAIDCLIDILAHRHRSKKQ
ncbi:uncharacterized protein JCM6883_002615 [Sporobolomyces salmoneus]|uniref:uncharacterized protein n=1 Tax=Sporobolomyces salmoneus TaxID=183962 RepID=UPI0031760CC3